MTTSAGKIGARVLSSLLRNDLEYLRDVKRDPLGIEQDYLTATATLREYPTVPTLIHVTRRQQPELNRALLEIGVELDLPAKGSTRQSRARSAERAGQLLPAQWIRKPTMLR